MKKRLSEVRLVCVPFQTTLGLCVRSADQLLSTDMAMRLDSATLVTAIAGRRRKMRANGWHRLVEFGPLRPAVETSLLTDSLTAHDCHRP